MIRMNYPSFRGLNDEDVFKYFILQSKEHTDPTVRKIGNELEKLVRTKGTSITPLASTKKKILNYFGTLF